MDGSAWVILPTYDEAENIEAVVGGIRAAAPEVRILVVDDNSRDGTGALADRAGRRRPAPPRQAGPRPRLHGGLRARAGNGAGYVCEMDADLSHDPADLPRLIAPAIEDGADLVLGSRYVHGGGVENWNLQRRFISLAGCEYARRVLGVQIRDLTGGFKCFRADHPAAHRRAPPGAQGYAFQVELTYRTLLLGLKIVEVPIRFRERRLGESKMSAQIALEAAWRVPGAALRAAAMASTGGGAPSADPLVHEG